MKKTSLALAALVTTIGALASAETVDAYSATYYAETKDQVRLFLKVDAGGGSVLTPKFSVPADSILAFDVREMSEAIEQQKLSPERVNQQYSENSDGSNARMSRGGWICGIRVIDVLDEDLRESEMLDRDDFCLSQTMLKNLSVMEGNSQPVKEAMLLQKEKSDDSLLKSVSNTLNRIDADEQWRRENMPVEIAAGGGDRMISPIKDCGKGCLNARSEFGMRLHPVLRRKRLHKGIDLRAANGTEVVAVFDGKVLANRTETDRRRRLKGYGYYTIVIYPEKGMQTLYAHLSKQKLRNGQPVKQGQTVALSGATGIGTGPHLHFETHTLSRGVATVKNPRLFMSHLFASVAAFFKFFNLEKPS